MFENAKKVRVVGIDPGLRTCGVAAAMFSHKPQGWLLEGEARVFEYAAEQTRTRVGTARQARDLVRWLAGVFDENKYTHVLVVVEEPINMPGRGQLAILGYAAVLQGILRGVALSPFLLEGYAAFPRASQIRSYVWGSRERGAKQWLLESFGVASDASSHVVDAVAAMYLGFNLLGDGELLAKLKKQGRLEALRGE